MAQTTKAPVSLALATTLSDDNRANAALIALPAEIRSAL